MGNKVGGDAHRDTQRSSPFDSRFLIRGKLRGTVFSLTDRMEGKPNPHVSLSPKQQGRQGEQGPSDLSSHTAARELPLAVTLFVNPVALQGNTVTKFSPR